MHRVANGLDMPLTDRHLLREFLLHPPQPPRSTTKAYLCSFLSPLPGFAERTFPVVYTAVGSNVYLPCTLNFNPTDYGISEVTNHWRYMARDIQEAKYTHHRGNKRHFTLHLPVVGPDDAGEYICEVTIRGTIITKVITLVVMTGEARTWGEGFKHRHTLPSCLKHTKRGNVISNSLYISHA